MPTTQVFLHVVLILVISNWLIMTFYYKFTKLPFVYVKVEASNKTIADAGVSKYRSDFIRFGAKQVAISFDDLYSVRFTHKLLKDIAEVANYEITESKDGKSYVVELPKNSLLDALKAIYSDVPGIKDANIFIIGGRSCFGVKNTPKFTKWMMEQLGTSETPKELKQKDAFIPICIFKETKNAPTEKQEVKLLK